MALLALDVNGITLYVAGVSDFFYLTSYLGESHILCHVTIELEIVYFHGCIAFHDVNISQCIYTHSTVDGHLDNFWLF